VLALLILVRILVIARFDPVTAQAIISASGTADVLAGTLLALLPYIMGGVAMALAMAAGLMIVERRRRSAVLLVESAAGSVALLTLAISPWPIAVPYLIAAGLVAVNLVLLERESGPKPSEQPWDDAIAVVTITALYVLIALSAAIFSFIPWQPEERLTIEDPSLLGVQVQLDGDEAVIGGYVLKADDREMVILTERERQVLRLPVAQIVARQACKHVYEDWGWIPIPEDWARFLRDATSMAELLSRGESRAHYPECPM
jgi:hypothetical protein